MTKGEFIAFFAQQDKTEQVDLMILLTLSTGGTDAIAALSASSIVLAAAFSKFKDGNLTYQNTSENLTVITNAAHKSLPTESSKKMCEYYIDSFLRPHNEKTH